MVLANSGDNGGLESAERKFLHTESRSALKHTLRRNLVASVVTGAFAGLKVEFHSNCERIPSAGYGMLDRTEDLESMRRRMSIMVIICEDIPGNQQIYRNGTAEVERWLWIRLKGEGAPRHVFVGCLIDAPNVKCL